MTDGRPRRRIVTPKRAVTAESGPLDTEALRALAERAWELHAEAAARHRAVVVGPMPILYFGDSDAYARSPLRVVTVGINPSDDEFPSSPDRFPDAKGCTPMEKERYLSSLDRYFEKNPCKWFGALEPLLRGFSASYWPGEASAALHTDFCTPIATRPTWSHLARADAAAKRWLRESGIPLWHDLVRALAPDVIVLGLGEEYLADLDLPRDGRAEAKKEFVYTKSGAKRREAYVVSATWRSVGAKSALVVHGRAWQTPYGCLSNEDRESVGAWARELVVR